MNNDSVKIEVVIAGQKMILGTTPANEKKLRAASLLVDEQIGMITANGNRSIERAALMAALKFAGTIQELQEQLAQNTAPAIDHTALDQLSKQLNAIETEVDIALECLSLPGSPRSIVP